MRASKNQDADLKAALEVLQKDSGYLFGDDQGAPPPYSAGTGTQNAQNTPKAAFNFGFMPIRTANTK